jgi:hypothetical protein
MVTSSNIHRERQLLGPTPRPQFESNTPDSSPNETDASTETYYTSRSQRYSHPDLNRSNSQPQTQDEIRDDTQGYAEGQFISGSEKDYVPPEIAPGQDRPPTINRSNSQPQTQREMNGTAHGTARSEFGKQDVQIWSHKKERYIPAEALLDVGCRGPSIFGQPRGNSNSGRNFISEDYVTMDLQDPYTPFPPGEEHTSRGHGGHSKAKGMVRLKFQPIYPDKNGVQTKGNIHTEIFYVDEGVYGDMLLGSDFLERNHVIKIQPFWSIQENPPTQSTSEYLTASEWETRLTGLTESR